MPDAAWEAPTFTPQPTGPVAIEETNFGGLTPGARGVGRPDPACDIAGCGHPRSAHSQATPNPFLFSCSECDTGCLVHSAFDGAFWPREHPPL